MTTLQGASRTTGHQVFQGNLHINLGICPLKQSNISLKPKIPVREFSVFEDFLPIPPGLGLFSTLRCPPVPSGFPRSLRSSALPGLSKSRPLSVEGAGGPRLVATTELFPRVPFPRRHSAGWPARCPECSIHHRPQ